jgi:hypothetical protein
MFFQLVVSRSARGGCRERNVYDEEKIEKDPIASAAIAASTAAAA